MSIELGVIHDVVHLLPYLALLFRPCVHTFGPLVAFVDVHIKCEISAKWLTTLGLFIELLEYLHGEFGVRAFSFLEERCDDKSGALIWTLC